MNYKGINHLANVLDERTKAISYQPLLLDFGEILDGFKLKTNSYPIPIPPEDYLVCRHVTWGKKREVLTATQKTGTIGDGRHPHGDDAKSSENLDPSKTDWGNALSGEHSHDISCTKCTTTSTKSSLHQHPNTEGAHIHAVLIPESMRTLKPGDKVLVAWVGNDPVVIDIILPATDLEKKRWDPYE